MEPKILKTEIRETEEHMVVDQTLVDENGIVSIKTHNLPKSDMTDYVRNYFRELIAELEAKKSK
jgi:hypothetical protein